MEPQRSDATATRFTQTLGAPFPVPAENRLTPRIAA
jgi:hypothetical protein